MKQRILTGIKPTGTGMAHLGNFFGMIKPSLEFAQNDDYDCFYFIADYHALTTVKNRNELIENTYNIACAWLACGLDTNKVTFFKQSDISEDCELFWILCNLTTKGLMNRAHAYKAMVEKNVESGQDKDNGVNMGLYNYPILMASDILLFNSSIIPVGLDQTQHVEIARDIANTFNKTFTNTFVLPKCYVQDDTSIILGTDGRKMSKSYNNTIELFCDEKQLQKKINRIVTDSRLPGEKKDTDNTICKLYKLFATSEEYNTFCEKLSSGLAWGEAKKELFTLINNYLAPKREKYEYYQNHRELVDEILSNGAKKAKIEAQIMLDKVKTAIGIKK